MQTAADRSKARVARRILAAYAAGGARDFSGRTLAGVVLCDCDLQGASFRNCNLFDADFGWADLRGVDFTGANLTDAWLTGADLRGADFQGACLRNAEMTGVDLVGANLEGAYTLGAILHAVRWYPHQTKAI